MIYKNDDKYDIKHIYIYMLESETAAGPLILIIAL